MKHINAKWAARLMRSKHFVLLTDTDSVIYFKGANPESFNDLLALTAQTNALVAFSKRMNKLIKEHGAAVDKLMKGDRNAHRAKARSKVKKIPVKG